MVFYTSMAPDFVYSSMAPFICSFQRKSWNSLPIVENSWTLLILKTSWLVPRFIFWVDRVGAAPDLSEPQAIKNVSLPIIVDQTFTFYRTLFKKLHHVQVLVFDKNGQSGSGTLLPLQLPLPRKFAVSASTSVYNWLFGNTLLVLKYLRILLREKI